MARLENPRRLALATIATLAAVSIAACQTSAPRSFSEEDEPGVPEAGTMPPEDAERFSIVSERSELRVLVYRDGPMAKLGHNHVIRSTSLSGSVWLTSPLADSLVSIILPVTTMDVDDPAARAEAGEDFPGTLDAKAISGTRDNMLGEKLLNAAQYPFMRLSCGSLSDAPARSIDCRVMIAGATAELRFPLTLTQFDNRLIATGERDVTHAELGLTPYSVGLGALRVADTIRVRYTIEAQRLSDN